MVCRTLYQHRSVGDSGSIEAHRLVGRYVKCQKIIAFETDIESEISQMIMADIAIHDRFMAEGVAHHKIMEKELVASQTDHVVERVIHICEIDQTSCVGHCHSTSDYRLFDRTFDVNIAAGRASHPAHHRT